MNQLHTLIAGHSHAIALGVPLKSASTISIAPSLIDAPGFGGLTGPWPRTAAYWDELIAQASNLNTVISWQGNQYLARYLFALAPKIDFVLSSNPELAVEGSNTIIPELAMRETLQPSLRDLEELLGRLRKEKHEKKIMVTGSPPPKDDDEFCRRYLSLEQGFVQNAAKLGYDIATIEFTAPIIRLKCWMLLQDMMQEICRRGHVTFLPAPTESLSAEGFLAREYWADDATHANNNYGKLVIQQIEQTLNAQPSVCEDVT